MNLEPKIKENLESWLKPPFDQETINELQALVDSGDGKEIYERFYTELEFGTGGLRGIMGAGLNRMNLHTVGRATQGLANYLKKVSPGGQSSVAVACDSRLQSDEFAQDTACVLAANGIKVYLYESLRPTPVLSFAVRQCGASAGIVITASHNPKEYNGYKVYWNDGAQVVPPHDKGIIDEVKSITDFGAIQRMDFEQAKAQGLIEMLGKEMDEAFIKAILALSIQPDLCREQADKVKIVYTPIHGSGITVVPEALSRWGFTNVQICESQQEPDGSFPTVKSPNPEEPAALALAIAQAKETGADLVLATDPDADRVGIAVRDGDNFQLLSGNQMASLLVEYVLSSYAAGPGLPDDARVIKTIVTTELIAAIAAKYDVVLENVLTGFKYIGEKIGGYEKSGVGKYLVGGEESHGYLVGTHARDKDAVVSCCFIAELAADSVARGESLIERLDRVFSQYGIFQESLMSMTFPGAEGKDTIARLMSEFRDNPPKDTLGSTLVELRDYQSGQIKDAATGSVTGQTGLPTSNVLVFRLADGSQVVARPSGTEPKIKFYFGVNDKESLPIGDKGELESRKAALKEKHDQLRQSFADLVEKVVG